MYDKIKAIIFIVSEIVNRNDLIAGLKNNHNRLKSWLINIIVRV
jgi:hypothetical protein